MADAPLIPPNSTCLLEVTDLQASVLFSLLTRATGIPGSKQTHRSRLLNHLKTQLDEFEAARMELIKEHAVKDDKGEPDLNKADNSYTLVDPDAFTKAFQDLRKEQQIIIDGRGDELKNRALCMAYELLNSDGCPELAPPHPRRPVEEAEALQFAPLLDAFKFEARPKA